jgi:Fic family protein
MDKIFEIVQASAALEGSTLTQAECARLLSEGISSEGKTIAEQLLCLNLRAAYDKCFQMAATREFWTVYRLKNLATLALRDSGVSPTEVSDERVLQKICDIANERRLHVNSDDSLEQYKASFEIHFLVSTHRPWLAGNDYIARLLMNYLQYECRLEPTIIRPSKRAEYLRILSIAKTEEIGEIFISYMADHCCDRPEKEREVRPAAPAAPKAVERPVAKPSAKAVEKAAAPKLSSRDQICALLQSNPYLSTRDLAEQIGISAKGVEKQLGVLKASGRLRRIGPDKGGKWQVL